MFYEVIESFNPERIDTCALLSAPFPSLNRRRFLVRAIVAALAVFAAASAPLNDALAAWTVTPFVDPMTDRHHAVATVSSPEGVLLRVRCLNGRPFPDIVFPGVIGFGEIGITHRIDSAAPVPRIAPTGTDGRSLYLLESVPALSRAKRLRVTVFPIGADSVFLDFDLTGAGEAISAVRAGCGR